MVRDQVTAGGNPFFLARLSAGVLPTNPVITPAASYNPCDDTSHRQWDDWIKRNHGQRRFKHGATELGVFAPARPGAGIQDPDRRL